MAQSFAWVSVQLVRSLRWTLVSLWYSRHVDGLKNDNGDQSGTSRGLMNGVRIVRVLVVAFAMCVGLGGTYLFVGDFHGVERETVGELWNVLSEMGGASWVDEPPGTQDRESWTEMFDEEMMERTADIWKTAYAQYWARLAEGALPRQVDYDSSTLESRVQAR